MLASLLPGVRDLRNPLAVGYTLFIAAWLIFRDVLPSKQTATGIAASVYQLAEAFGNNATVAAVSFIAYLFGSTMLVSHIPRWIAQFGWVGGNRTLSNELEESTVTASSIAASQFYGRTGERSLHAMVPPKLSRDLADFDDRLRAEELASFFQKRTQEEASNAVSRLQVKSPPLFDAYDRQMAEAELRLSMFVPLSIMVIVLAIRWQSWALIFTLVPIILAYQGARKEISARRVLSEAFSDGLVESQTMERLNAWFKREPERKPAS